MRWGRKVKKEGGERRAGWKAKEDGKEGRKVNHSLFDISH